jgi:hypothetical protein
MHSRTQATLQSLANAEWFCCVGIRDATAAETLSSWSQAVKHCSSTNWENLCLEAANQYRRRLSERSPELLLRWNSIVDEIKPTVLTLVEQKTKEVITENKLPKVFVDTVNWDILHLCMESEYADVYPPGFYASQAYWYLKGHFPCGWRGRFPEGRLVIY